jgi:CDP-diacylglycerol---glycerol-3-phosphate 3-phosphatidyltransferase
MTSKQPITLTDRLRKLTQAPLNRLGLILSRLGIHPDTITIFGLILVGIAAVLIASGGFLWGGVMLIISLPLDAVDGAVARAMKRTSAFGMVLDSTLDRYADGFIFASLSYYFAVQDRFDMMGLALVALMGSFLVSYVRARADDAKVSVATTVGLFTRVERVIVILVMILGMGLFNQSLFLEIGVLVLAIGTNFTALQRLLFVYTALKDRGE